MQPVWRTTWQLLKTWNVELTHEPSTPLQGIYSKYWKVGTGTDICTLMFTAAPLTVTDGGSSPSVYWGINKQIVVCAQGNVIQPWKLRGFWHMLHWMNLAVTMLSGVSQSQKDKFHESTYIQIQMSQVQRQKEWGCEELRRVRVSWIQFHFGKMK